MDNATVAGLTITTMLAAGELFGKTLPNPHELRDQAPTEANIRRVQQSYISAAPLAVGVGVGASLMSKSWWPLIAVLAIASWLWWQYLDAVRAEVQGVVPAGVVKARYA